MTGIGPLLLLVAVIVCYASNHTSGKYCICSYGMIQIIFRNCWVISSTSL